MPITVLLRSETKVERFDRGLRSDKYFQSCLIPQVSLDAVPNQCISVICGFTFESRIIVLSNFPLENHVYLRPICDVVMYVYLRPVVDGTKSQNCTFIRDLNDYSGLVIHLLLPSCDPKTSFELL